MQKTLRAKKVREGDFIPALDNGYVFEVKRDAYVSFDPTYGTNGADASTVLIGFHDSAGNDNYMLLGVDTPITVERP